MKYFKYVVGGKELVIKLDEDKQTVADIKVDGEALRPTEEEMPRYAAVMALALLQYDAEVIHDEEEGVLTIKSEHENWGAPGNNWNCSGAVAITEPLAYPLASEGEY